MAGPRRPALTKATRGQLALKSLLELTGILSMLVVVGAISWLGFAVIGTSIEAGDGSRMTRDLAGGPLTVGGIALAINLLSGHLRKRF